MDELLKLLMDASVYAKMKREAEREYRPIAERIKKFMQDNNLTELVAPDGTKAKLTEANRINFDREAALDLLDHETFELIVNRVKVPTLKVI